MELKEYFRIVQRWLWLLVLGLVLGGAGGYLFSRYQTPVYQTTTKVLVRSSTNGMASDAYAGYYGDQQLAQTYVQLLTTQPFLDGVKDALGYGVSSKQITVQQVEQGIPIIKITVEDADPQKAADIANNLVQVLIDRNESLQTGQYAASEQSLQVQITQVQEQIAQYQSDLDNISTKSISEQLTLVQAQMEPLQTEATQLQKDIALLTPAWNQERKSKIAEMQARLDQITPLLNLYQQIYTNLVVLGNPGASVSNDSPAVARLQSTLDLYQQIYLNLINSRESIRLARLQNTPNVVQIEAAPVPFEPVRPQPVSSTLLAGAVGLMLMAGLVFLIEYLDDTLRTPEDVERALKLPVIGYIAEMQAPKSQDEYLYVNRQPRSPVSEAFRSLRVNLEYAGVDRPLHTILVTSPGPGEGKTTVAANLAAIIAQAGKNVLLLDADLRRPKIHKVLGVTNRIGLSDLFRERLSLQSVRNRWNGTKEMAVITSGTLPPNPAELLGSDRMGFILGELSSSAEVVVIDSPPTVVTDAQVMAPKVDGILLVIQPGQTRADSATAACEQFERAGGRLLGVVFNRIPRNRNHYYGGYRYYSPYYYSEGYYQKASKDAGLESVPVHKSEKQPPPSSTLGRLLAGESESEQAREKENFLESKDR